MVWGAYAQGFLTGRYTRDMAEPPPGSRITSSKPEESQLLGAAGGRPGVGTRRRPCEAWPPATAGRPANVAMACFCRAAVATWRCWARSLPEQLDDGLGALGLTLDGDDLAELDRLSRLPAPYPMNFWNTFCYRDSECYGGLR